MSHSLQIAIVGAAACDDATARFAYDTGVQLARGGATILCGGRGGVMAAACQGARAGGGRTVGILPGLDETATPANDDLDIVLYTGLNQARNQILVLSARSIVAIGGGWGTLSEISFALKFRVPVVLLESWNLRRPDGLHDPLLFEARTAADAARLALHASTRGAGPSA